MNNSTYYQQTIDDLYKKAKEFGTQDIHLVRSSIHFNKTIDLITPEERKTGKSLNYVLMYSSPMPMKSCSLDPTSDFNVTAVDFSKLEQLLGEQQ